MLCSGIFHFGTNILIIGVVLLMLFFLDVFPDADHISSFQVREGGFFATFGNLVKCFFGSVGCDMTGMSRGFLHDWRLLATLLLISTIWFVHLLFDYLQGSGRMVC